MKKSLLALCCAAVAMTASADKVTFVPQFGGYQPTAEDGTVITIPVTWASQTLYCDAFNMVIGNGSRSVGTGGGLSVANSTTTQAYIDFRPCAGITIKKVEFRMYPNAQSASYKTMFDNMTLDETGLIQRWTGSFEGNEALGNRLKFDLHVDGEAPVTTERVRLHAITVEYEGTVGRCLAPKASTNDVVTSDAITLTCDEPGATIWYSTNANATYYAYDQQPDELFEKYEGQPIVISQVTKLNAFATVDGKKKSALYYNWIVPGPEESHHAVFSFAQPMTLNPALEWTPLTLLTQSVANIAYNNNGVTYTNCSTASKDTNAVRFMSTDAYGMMGEIRFAANNNKNNNKLQVVVDNPENYICQITVVGQSVDSKFTAATSTVVKNDAGKYVKQDGYEFPDVVNYEDETAANYMNKVFKQTMDLPSATTRKYIESWRPSEDYEGDVNHVVFDMPDASTANINEVHVFYYGDAPQGGDTGVDGIVADRIDENAPVEYYNLQGVRVANPQGGIFIRRQGAKADKVYIK